MAELHLRFEHLGALLIAGLGAPQIRHVLEPVGKHAVRQSGLPRTIDKQLGLPFRIAAPLNEIAFRDPCGVKLFDVSGSCLCLSALGRERLQQSYCGVPESESLK